MYVVRINKKNVQVSFLQLILTVFPKELKRKTVKVPNTESSNDNKTI